MDMNEFEYQVLTRTWDGPYGAAYNAAYEFCKEKGWLHQKMDGFYVTEEGEKALAQYKKLKDFY